MPVRLEDPLNIPYRLEQNIATDRWATESVIRHLRPRLMRMAAFYARRSGEEMEDLLQEACVGMVEALEDVDVTIGQPEHYLIQRARWRLLDSLRRSQTQRCAASDHAAIDLVDDAAHASVLATACVNGFLSALPDLRRSIVICLLEGMTWRETGSVLGCTSANIAYHVRQIRIHFEEWRAEESMPVR